ncbi:hypothetical protein YQE_07361, partial [Dendroctonus ponderosae]
MRLAAVGHPEKNFSPQHGELIKRHLLGKIDELQPGMSTGPGHVSYPPQYSSGIHWRHRDNEGECNVAAYPESVLPGLLACEISGSYANGFFFTPVNHIGELWRRIIHCIGEPDVDEIQRATNHSVNVRILKCLESNGRHLENLLPNFYDAMDNIINHVSSANMVSIFKTHEPLHQNRSQTNETVAHYWRLMENYISANERLRKY